MEPFKADSAAQMSLRRLKALDSFPDLESQLQEATQLCTHSARADMILKWLLENFRKSEETGRAYDAWTLLNTTMRLLLPERLATLLVTSDLLQIVEDSLLDSKADSTLFDAVAACLQLLLELSSDIRGAALRALLSVDAARAASFFGTWLHGLSKLAAIAQPEKAWSNLSALLRPAVQIWTLRKQRADENELFAKECLVPVARLLSVISERTSAWPTKRKRRDANGSAAVDCKGSLETVLAKHVFLPARLSFFSTHVKQLSKTRQRETESTATGLTDRLQTLKTAIEHGHLKTSALPTLLDVALRCIPAVGPRQRMQDRPWVEAIFAALLACIDEHAIPKDRQTLIMMLEVIGDRVSLSRGVLLGLAKSYGGFLHDNGIDTDWKLVAQIIALDANVFADPGMADTLFSALSVADSVVDDSGHLKVEAFLRQNIMVPIMQAFAKSRSLASFIELWRKQLVVGTYESSVWLQLAGPFSELVESSMTQEQIVQLVTRLCQSFNDKTATGFEIPADTVLLAAALDGVRSTDLSDAVQPDVEAFIEEVLTHFDQYAFEGMWYHIWRLLTMALNLWFPSWAAQQNDKQVIIKRADSILSSAAAGQAEDLLADVEGPLEAVRDEKFDARCFYVSLVQLLRPYTSKVPETYMQATRGLDAQDLSIPLWCPTLLTGQDLADNHHELLDHCFEKVSETVGDGKDIASYMDGQRALIAASTQRPQTVVIAVIVEKALAYLQPGGQPYDAARMLAAVAILVEVPANAFSTEQRERILNAVVALPQYKEHGQKMLQMRLALMMQLLEEPCPKADMFTKPLLWQLADVGHALARGKATDVSGERKTLELLERLAGRVVGHLLQHQGASSAKDTLLALAMAAQTAVMQAESNGFAGRLYHLSLVKTLFAEFDAKLRPELSEQCLKAELVELYVISLTSDAMKFAQVVGADEERRIALIAVLDALARQPRRIKTDALHELECHKAVLDIIGKYDIATGNDSMDGGSAESGSLILVRCFQVLAQKSLAEATRQDIFIPLARGLVDRDLPPQEHAADLSAFSTACQDADAGFKVRVLQSCLPDGGQPTAASLLLLKAVISALSREDFMVKGAADGDPPQVYLHRLLGALADAGDLKSCHRASECLVTILKTKPFMTNQHTIEATLATLKCLAERSGSGSRVAFLDTCRVTTALLQHHRSRLRDRLHMVFELLHALIGCFFRKSYGGNQETNPLSGRHAHVLARLLQLLCNPPQLRGKPRLSDLVDDARKAQSHTGQYVQYVLHHYCSQVLKGTLGEGVREVLMPGLWAMIEAMEVYDADAFKSLSTAMSNSERAVLRSLYDEYQAFGKWRGG